MNPVFKDPLDFRGPWDLSARAVIRGLLGLPVRLVAWVLLELLVLLAVSALLVHLALWDRRERKALKARRALPPS